MLLARQLIYKSDASSRLDERVTALEESAGGLVEITVSNYCTLLLPDTNDKIYGKVRINFPQSTNISMNSTQYYAGTMSGQPIYSYKLPNYVIANFNNYGRGSGAMVEITSNDNCIWKSNGSSYNFKISLMQGPYSSSDKVFDNRLYVIIDPPGTFDRSRYWEGTTSDLYKLNGEYTIILE